MGGYMDHVLFLAECHRDEIVSASAGSVKRV
jgi:hypothetical protein